MKAFELAGAKNNKFKHLNGVCIKVPITDIFMVQELHLPIYHCMCLMLETAFLRGNKVMEKQMLLNTYINDLTMQEAIKVIEKLLVADKKSYIVPINVDVVMKIEDDPYLKKVVDSGHEDLLDKINIAWFGGREVYSNDVFPKDWEQIYDDLMMFRFNLSGDNSRKNIVNRLAETDGYKSYMESVKKEKQTSLSYRERAEYLHDFLEESSPMVAQSEIPVINM